jgi:purine-binding chemotaxis protein CheW
VDWGELRRKLEEIQARAAAAASPEQVRAVLRERARLLAQPLEGETDDDMLEVVVFGVGSERCAIESRFVLQVLAQARLTPLPRVAPPAVGVTGWRGDVLTVMDLRLVLQGIEDTRADEAHARQVMVIGDGRQAVGVIVTAGLDLQHVGLSALLPSEAGSARPHLRGITPDAISILDAAALIRQLTEGAPL